MNVDKKPSFNVASLKKDPTSPRTLFGLIMSSIAGLFTFIAVVPLFIILGYLIFKGIGSISLASFTQLPPPPFADSGGFGNAIIGTIAMVGVGALLSVPIGIMAAIYLSEFDGVKEQGWQKILDLIIKIVIGSVIGLFIGIIINNFIEGKIGIAVIIICVLGFAIVLTRVDNTAQWIRFATNVLSGVPSIIVGVFAYSVIVLNGFIFPKGYSAWAGGFALAILMLPIIVRTTDESLKLVPQEVRQASVGIGANQYQTVLQVVLPAALPAIITGVTLSVARAAGETAPLIFTALFNQFWNDSLSEPTASLSVLVYNFAITPYDNQQELAWAAAFVLVVLVLITSVASRLATAKRTY